MSRASIIAMLVAAEVLIAGMAIYTLSSRGPTFVNGMHRVSFTADPIAPIAAGADPRVAIDDPDSRVSVAISSDGLVHVRDLTQMRGAIFSNSRYPQLRVTRTADGVRIERSPAGHLSIAVFGFSTEAIEVEVPSGSHVQIARCSGASVAGIAGDVEVQSQDGHVMLRDLTGAVDARTDEGSLSATNVRGDRLTMVSSDGRLTLDGVTVGSLVAQTREGRVEASDLTIAGARPEATLHSDDGPVHASGTFAANGSYELSSNEGSIDLRLAQNADLAIEASTVQGRIVVDGSSESRDDVASRTLRLGAGSGRMKLATADGSIHIFTNGDFQRHGF